MYIKIHHSYRKVVALCDSELIGKKFEEGKRQLNLHENFYKGRLIAKQEAMKILQKEAREDATFSIVGKKAINVAIDAGLISEDSFDKIQNIPFILILL